jgi:hypothetical protein
VGEQKAVFNISGIISLTLLGVGASGCGSSSTGCGDIQPTETPVEIEEWNVDMQRYADIQAAAEMYEGAAWDTRDEQSRCRLACAFASDLVYEYSDRSYYDSLEFTSCELTIPTADTDGVLACSATHSSTPICVGGRRPLAWQGEPRAITELGAQLAGMATMEQVSITAFVELGAQLEGLGAPTRLVERCREAAEDERRHVALLLGLGAPVPCCAPEPAPRETPVVEITVHNATEGCVTETWAALLAHHQAQYAADAATRQAFAEIAADEARHAQLAWELHDWLLGRLEPGARARVEAARAGELAGLEARAIEQALAIPGEVRRALGLPDPRRAAALARDFGRRLAAA